MFVRLCKRITTDCFTRLGRKSYVAGYNVDVEFSDGARLANYGDLQGNAYLLLVSFTDQDLAGVP